MKDKSADNEEILKEKGFLILHFEKRLEIIKNEMNFWLEVIGIFLAIILPSIFEGSRSQSEIPYFGIYSAAYSLLFLSFLIGVFLKYSLNKFENHWLNVKSTLTQEDKVDIINYYENFQSISALVMMIASMAILALSIVAMMFETRNLWLSAIMLGISIFAIIFSLTLPLRRIMKQGKKRLESDN